MNQQIEKKRTPWMLRIWWKTEVHCALLTEEWITVGSDLNNEISIPDPLISQFHFSIRMMPLKNFNVHILDLDSANGTYLNGIRISDEERILDRDMMEAGDTRFRLEALDSNLKRKPKLPIIFMPMTHQY